MAKINRRAIDALPTLDGEPPLCRSMFAFSSYNALGGKLSTYRGRAIHFGCTYKEGFDWKQWREKFESLLRRMYWEHAIVVHVSEMMGAEIYQWTASKDSLELFAASPPVPVRDWTFEKL